MLGGVKLAGLDVHIAEQATSPPLPARHEAPIQRIRNPAEKLYDRDWPIARSMKEPVV
jgi:hypothetical protein